MKTNIEHFALLSSEELLETNGGGFAYDFGRVLRFIAKAMPGDPGSIAYASGDWYATTLINNS